MKKKSIISLVCVTIVLLIIILVGYNVWVNNKDINSHIFYGKNKNYISVGDSITYNDGKEYQNTNITAKGYQTLMNEEIGFSSVKNFGISGASMAKPLDYPKHGSLSIDDGKKDYSSANLVTIFAGTNDFRLNLKLGRIGNISNKDFNINTFYGAYRYLIEDIQKQNPTAKIYLFTPIQRNNAGYDTKYRNIAGHTLIDYVNAVKNIGKLYNLPVIDLYSASGINEDNLKSYTVDGLHPNNSGYQLIAKQILKVIKK